jgi:NAD(P)-dependent dehydrogenase (short-subunit alcohol dehydrogenase family)
MTAETDALDGPGPLLTDRVALITGGAMGIGAGTAELFARHGARLVLVDVDEPALDATASRLRAAGATVDAVVADVRDDAAVRRFTAEVLERNGRIDVLVNNVGHYVRFVGDFVDGDPGFWDEVYRLNLLHVFTVTHAVLPAMLERRSGSIVNVSSVEGLRGYPAEPVYGAFKAAVVQFTRCLGVQVAHHGVRVNGVGPDVTETPQVPYSTWLPPEQQALWPLWVPVGRVGLPADQARVILFLASDLSAFVTGHTIPTDGGTGAAGGWFRSTSRPGRTWTNRPVSP